MCETPARDACAHAALDDRGSLRCCHQNGVQTEARSGAGGAVVPRSAGILCGSDPRTVSDRGGDAARKSGGFAARARASRKRAFRSGDRVARGSAGVGVRRAGKRGAPRCVPRDPERRCSASAATFVGEIGIRRARSGVDGAVRDRDPASRVRAPGLDAAASTGTATRRARSPEQLGVDVGVEADDDGVADQQRRRAQVAGWAEHLLRAVGSAQLRERVFVASLALHDDQPLAAAKPRREVAGTDAGGPGVDDVRDLRLAGEETPRPDTRGSTLAQVGAFDLDHPRIMRRRGAAFKKCVAPSVPRRLPAPSVVAPHHEESHVTHGVAVLPAVPRSMVSRDRGSGVTGELPAFGWADGARGEGHRDADIHTRCDLLPLDRLRADLPSRPTRATVGQREASPGQRANGRFRRAAATVARSAAHCAVR